MNEITQKLRARAIESGDGYLRGLALAAADHIDAQAAEIAHKDAEIARLRADQAEKDAEIRSLKHELASMRFRLSGVDMRRQAPIARAALSGEGK